MKSTIHMIESQINYHSVTGKGSSILLMTGNLTLEKVIMKNNTASKGVLISTGETNVYIINSKFLDNRAKQISAGL